MSDPRVTIEHLRSYGGIPPAVLKQKDPTFVNDMLNGCLDTAYGYVRASEVGPFVELPLAFIMAVCKMAAYEIMLSIGYNPEASGDTNYQRRNDDAIAWLKSVGKGEALMTPVADATPGRNEGAPEVYSSPLRGW